MISSPLYPIFCGVLIPVWCNWNKSLLALLGVTSTGFNSCMVQLKWVTPTAPPAPRCVLIPVWCNWNNTSPFFLFTHKGSFNSCMVQLKSDHPCWHFLPKPVLIPVWCNWNPKFVVPKKSISTVLIPVWCNWNGVCLGQRNGVCCFNSCMVQLKSFSFSVLRLRECRFNSCMVQLKWTVVSSSAPALRRFNSCMVQLKLHHSHVVLGAAPLF